MRGRPNPVCDRDWDDAHLINAADGHPRDDPEFGYRFICDELDLEHGIRAGENRVSRLCSQQGIWSVTVRRRGTGRRPGPAVHDDRVKRDFTAAGPNQLWLTDITEHPTDEGKLYLCAVKDCFAGRIVGYSIDDRMTSQLAVNALTNAVLLRDPVGTVVPLRPGRPVSLPQVRPCTGSCGTDRFDGQGCRLRRQRRNGVVLLAAAEERPGPQKVAHPRRAPAGDHHLDRTHLPPPPSSTRTRSTHTHRV